MNILPVKSNLNASYALAAAALLTLPQLALAVNTTWLGNTDANFSTLANWANGTPNANTPIFGAAGSSGTNLNNDISGATYAGITYNAGASAFTISGSSFTLTGNIVNNSTSTQTINTNIVISGANRTFNAASGQLVVGGNLSGTPGTTQFTPTNKITLSGSNNLTLSTNFGGLIVNSGTGGMDITGTTIINGAAGNTFSGYMNVNGNTTLTVKSGGSLAINGTPNASKPDSGIGNNVTGTSTILVEGSLTYGAEQGLMIGNNRADATGVLTVSSGTATIIAGGTPGSTDIRSFVAMGRDGGNGVVNLDGGTLETSRRFVRDGGSGGTAGTGTANFNFNGGTLKALSDQTAGNGWFETGTTGNFQVVTTTVKAGGAKIDTNGFTTNINTVLAHDSALGATPDGGLTKIGSGTLSLGGANTYTGNTTINAGTLVIGDTGQLGAGSYAGNISNAGTFSFASSAAQTLSGAISGTGALTKTVGSGVLTLSGSNTYTGNTTISAGTLQLSSQGSMTFALGANGVNNMITGTGFLTLEGTFVFDLSGASIVDGNSWMLVDVGSLFATIYDPSFAVAGFTESSDVWTKVEGNSTWTFTESTGVLDLTVVPEPASIFLVVGGLSFFMISRRRAALV